jgi:hypothetical protein
LQPIRQDFGISGTLIGGYLADRLAREGYGNANLRMVPF